MRYEAPANGFAKGQTAIALKRTVIDENTHVKALKGALDRKAVKSPKFDFGTTTTNASEFLATAYALENPGVQAYYGQVFNQGQALPEGGDHDRHGRGAACLRVRAAGAELGGRDLAEWGVRPRQEGEADPEHRP
jgi:hypothetical protein